ncbi:MAG TPA: ABC transporter permease [Dokdonella sp.]|uniref:ABC transporter permease n=1 Tax=Dokdonella sp. TaxID=2291710 RepID=UPI002D803768|nr:ABC transporter permease [Dokdonella sp.]HET9032392.1 ABC transporter permease [Dokdonella sp.]
MNTMALTPAQLLGCYYLEAKYEFLRLWRTPSFVLPSLLFPSMFYILFGVLLGGGRAGNDEAARYLLASYGVFGIMGAALFGFGVNVAIERERGFLTLKRALPMPPGAYLVAKLIMAMIFALIISLMLGVIASTMAGVSLSASQWLLLLMINVIGTLPFSAMGLLIGTTFSGQASPAIVNLIYLPMAFLSGLWLPLSMLPKFIGTLAPVWPSHHLVQIALKVVGRDTGGSLGMHVLVLIVITIAFFVLARRRLVEQG